MAYLDHAATTPMLPEAVDAYVAASGTIGNASSLRAAGRLARRRVEEAREQVAAVLGARPSEVIFTGGGTESDNLAVKGIFWARRAADPARTRVVAGSVEHHAVLDAVGWLGAHEGATVSWLPVGAAGRVRPEELREALDDDVALVTSMWANNEVGTVQPVAELAALAAARGVPYHTDAVQAVGQVPVDFAASGAAALTVSGHKLGGPVGVGALLPGCEGDALLLLLDAAGVACSTGSACSAGVAQPSHVLLAMGADESRARSSLRFTLGHTSTSADIEELVAALPGAVERARRAGVAKSRR